MTNNQHIKKKIQCFRGESINPDGIGRRRSLDSQRQPLKPRSDGLELDDETRQHLLRRIRKIPTAGQPNVVQKNLIKRKPLSKLPTPPSWAPKDTNHHNQSNQDIMINLQKQKKKLKENLEIVEEHGDGKLRKKEEKKRRKSVAGSIPSTKNNTKVVNPKGMGGQIGGQIRGHIGEDGLMQSMMKRLKMLETKCTAQEHEIHKLERERRKTKKQLEEQTEEQKQKQRLKQQQIDKMLKLIENMAEYMAREEIKHPFYDKIIEISQLALNQTMPSFDTAFQANSKEPTKLEQKQQIHSIQSMQQAKQAKQAKQEEEKEETKKINMELIKQRVEQLNSILTNERKIKVSNNAAKFEEAPSITLTFYQNGMMIDNRAFRPYSWNITKAFLTDIFDGYFPYEFKDTYPDGIQMMVQDKTNQLFSKADHLAANIAKQSRKPNGMITQLSDLNKEFQAGRGDKEAFLKKLPKQVIRNGHIVSVRDDIRNMLSTSLRDETKSNETSQDHLSEEVLSQKEEINVWTTCQKDLQNGKTPKEAHATLRFRLPPMKGIKLRTLIVKIYASETIEQLRKYVDKHINRNGAYAYRIRAFPNTWLDSDEMTVQEAGLLPNASLFIQAVVVADNV